MAYCSEADRAHVAAALAQGATAHARALSARLQAEQISRDAAHQPCRPRLRLVPQPSTPESAAG